MKNFFKKTGAFIGLFFLAALFFAINPQTGVAFAAAVTAVATWAMIRPIARIGLRSRLYSAAIAVFIGLLFLTMSITEVNRQDPAYMAALKISDPEKYLSTLQIRDKAAWLAELKQIAPAQFAAEKARIVADALEAQRLAAQTEAAKIAAQGEASRLAAEATRLAAEAEASKAEQEANARRDQDMASIRTAIGSRQWVQARTQMEHLSRKGSEITEFREEIEAAVLAIVKPLPAGDLQLNRDGYALLAIIQPDNTNYNAKASDYDLRIKRQREGAVSVLRRSVDKVEGITWYHHPNEPRYLNSRSTAFFYIGRRGDNGIPSLRMKVQYTASDWLFVQDVTAWHDGVKEPLISGPFERDNNSTIWEWRDVPPDSHHIELMRSLAMAREAILRFEGQQYHRDVTLTAGDKKAILETLMAYEVMKSGG